MRVRVLMDWGATLLMAGATLTIASAERNVPVQDPTQPPGQQQVPPQQPGPQPGEAATETTLVPPVRPFRRLPRIGVLAEAQINLEQALAMALANNKDIEASRIDVLEGEYNVSGARGVFDPLVGANSFWQKQILPVASSLGGSATGSVLNRIWQTDPTVSGLLPWLGSSYRVDFASQRTFTNNSFATLNPQFPTSLNLQYTQPLWRGLHYDSGRHSLDVAKKNRSLTGEQFRQRVMGVIALTEQSYWELVYAYNNLQVQLEAVELGRQQDESNRRQEQQGLLAPIDVVAAQTQLANFELNAYTAQTALTRAENTLKTLMLAERTSPLWSSALTPMVPVNSPPDLTPLADAVNDAIANRPETALVQISGEINKDDARYYRDLTKPQVDLVASYTRAGLAGTQLPQGPNPFFSAFGPVIDRLNVISATSGLEPISLSAGGSTTPQLLVGGYGQSFSNLWAGDFPTTQVQLRISLPIHNRIAEANLNRSIAEGRRIRNQKEQIEQLIEADVRNGMEAVQSAQARLEAARVQRESAEEQYQSEQRQFRAGNSTLFLVQQRQSAMITSRSQERRAEADLGQAIAAFELSTASILRVHNINLR